ncbi:ATP-dependent DNA helicase [Rubripirellula amarantea]|nr:ATP-dependent RecD-like DNA helicase [Rubripirellula amarantea]
MRNFPTRNWSMRLSYSIKDTGVILPYHEYLDHVEDNPSDEKKFDEIKVLVEEPAIQSGFKYVCEQFGDDECLYLLYKMRRSFEAISDHGIVEVTNEIERIDGFIEQCWKHRGLYPGLPSIAGLLAELRDGDPNWEEANDHGLIEAIRENIDEDEETLETFFELLASTYIPTYLSRRQTKVLRRGRKAFGQYGNLEKVLKRLSLFDLTPRQLSRILFPKLAVGRKENHPFGDREVTHEQLTANPYILCEDYVAATDNDAEREIDKDRELPSDAKIDYFQIDIGMFPDDDRYDCWNDALLDLNAVGPERLRAFTVMFLRRQQDNGHTYSALDEIVDETTRHPLFYRNQFAVSKEQFGMEKCVQHFSERLHLADFEGNSFYYLKETKQAEEHVERAVQHLMNLPALKFDDAWIKPHLEAESDALCKLPSFDRERFIEERTRLISGVLSQRFFLVTGRPGSGKTRALREIIGKLTEAGEAVTVLAPTGKAALRVRSEDTGAIVETIDRWVNRSSLRFYLNDISKLSSMQSSGYYETIENLIIDETSMVDLPKFAVLLRAIEVHEPNIKRVILVGDENQLPPIGMGRVLFDLLEHMNRDARRAEKHVVRLSSNCRQKQDSTVVDAAFLFAGKNRYHTELYKKLLNADSKEPISEHLNVEYWTTHEELAAILKRRVNDRLGIDQEADAETREKAFNELFNQYETGFVKDQRDPDNKLNVEALQLLTPYRGGVGGTIMSNQLVRELYKANSYPKSRYDPEYMVGSAFGHSEKIIRNRNHYVWSKEEKKRVLVLSNGSIGVLCSNKTGRNGWFSESDFPLKWSNFDEEDFEPGYSISVHKSQGSEFDEVFVIIPERRALLCRELVYTAMTRSTGALTLLVQKTARENPLTIARQRSNLLRRNSSLFSNPRDARKIYEPEKGIHVKSKIEYMIYDALRAEREASRLTFMYEEKMELTFDGKRVEVKPDFTIRVDGRTYRWEHLGMLDRQDYSANWRDRLAAYKNEGLLDCLVTSDDLFGASKQKIQSVINDMISGELKGNSTTEFSSCHYDLSSQSENA